jgi:hypothetical protein
MVAGQQEMADFRRFFEPLHCRPSAASVHTHVKNNSRKLIPIEEAIILLLPI